MSTHAPADADHVDHADHAVVAVFDLDGTLARGHSLPRFALMLAGPVGVPIATLRALPHVVAGPTRERLKERWLEMVLRGRTEDDVRSVGERCASAIVADRVDAEMRAAVERHRGQGHQLVLLTAALDVYAASVADRLGFDACLSARVDVEDGVCTGRVHDADLTGETKLRRLRQWLGDRADHTTVFAYGNSSDDDAVLEWAADTQRRAPGVRR